MRTSANIFNSIFLSVFCIGIFLHPATAKELLVASLEIGAQEADLDEIAGFTYERANSKVGFHFNRITTDFRIDNECVVPQGWGYSLGFEKFSNGYEGGSYGFPMETPPDSEEQSWIFIENLGEKPISKIILKGSASEDTYLFCDVVLSDGQSGSLLDATHSLSSGIPFKVQNTCYEVTLDLTPVAIEGWVDYRTDHSYDEVRMIRFTNSKAGGETRDKKPSIQAIYVYTEDEEIPTGIDLAPEAGFTVCKRQHAGI